VSIHVHPKEIIPLLYFPIKTTYSLFSSQIDKGDKKPCSHPPGGGNCVRRGWGQFLFVFSILVGPLTF
jgi:hypothetical protein